jgi:hypothetical protein
MVNNIDIYFPRLKLMKKISLPTNNPEDLELEPPVFKQKNLYQSS